MNYSRRLSLAAATAATVATAALLFAAPGYAGPLTTADLNSPGDQLLTIDTNTGLEFLDPSATKAVSFNDTLQTPFVTQQGFQFATLDQFTQLLTDAGFTDFSGNFNTADEPAAKNLLNNFLGETIPPGQPFTLMDGTEISDGFYSLTAPPSSGLVNVAGVDYRSAALGQAPQDQARVTLNLNQVPLDTSAPILGSLLVRSANATAVPAPSGLGLMGLGLAMLIGLFVYRPHSVLDKHA